MSMPLPRTAPRATMLTSSSVRPRRKNNTIDPQVADQFKSGRLYAAIASRPGQAGRADGAPPPPTRKSVRA